jgi:DsbC/DsbD-like thiol-disulfide interchange protein
MDRAKDGFVTDRRASATVRALLALFALVLLAFAPARAQTTHIAPRLVAESVVPSPGGATTIALAMTPEKGWHGYWSNGGDAGFGMQVEWNAPPGVTVGAFRYPVPEALTLFGLMNHVYEHPYALLADVRVDKSVAPGTDLTLTGIANWLACTDKICVPEKAVISVAMKAGDGAIAAGAQQQFDAWRARLPQPLDRAGAWERRGVMVRFGIPLPEGTTLDVPHLFLETQGVIDYPAPQSFSRNGDWIIVEARAKGDAAGPIQGLLKLSDGRGLSVHFEPEAVRLAGEPIGAASRSIDMALFWTALGGAIIGGLILNLMPCVFPILSLKALSLARSGGDARDAKIEAVAYTAGAVVTSAARCSRCARQANRWDGHSSFSIRSVSSC